ncbi:MAG TPA: urea ABC transporter permease subunit UrtB, partial [Xanthobacteraceae bacterium]
MTTKRLAALALAIGLLLAGALPGAAQSFDETLRRFAADSFSETEAAVNAVAVSGNPAAAVVIEALRDGRLLVDPATQQVFVKDAGGAVTDAASGKLVGPPPANLKAVRLNNRLRRTVDAALGGLTLMAPDPGKRWEAAQAVFKSRDPAALPALDLALAKETDSGVKRALEQARAAVIVTAKESDEAAKLAAVATIRARGDQDALGLLAGLPRDIEPAVTQAASAAIASIQGDLALWSTAQDIWYGLSLGSVLL